MGVTRPVEPATFDAVARELAARGDLNLERLCQLVRVPSVSAPGFDPDPVRRCASLVGDLAREAGLQNVELLEVSGSYPYVYGEWTGRDDAPTVLLYAHHDVQPPGPTEDWTGSPFDPQVRDGRLYGRGAADDKAGVVLHLAAVEAWLRAVGGIPANVKILIDGEEEIGNPTLRDLLARELDRLRADVIVVADSVNWRVGEPAVTYSLRGVVSLVLELRALDRAVHSGIWGGPVPDSLMALCNLLSTLVDERGVIAVDGFLDDLVLPGGTGVIPPPPEFDEEELRRRVRTRPGVRLCGYPDRPLLDRLWWFPSVTVIAIEAPRVLGSSNTIQAGARARISIRLGPGQDPEAAADRLIQHLKNRAPWGLELSVEVTSLHPAWFRPPSGPVFEAADRAFARAFGVPVRYVGMGGTVPLVSWLGTAMGDVPCLLTGVEDPDSQAHGPDESVHVEDWYRGCEAETLFLGEVGGVAAQ